MITKILSCPPYRWYFGRRVIPSKIPLGSLCSLRLLPPKTEAPPPPTSGEVPFCQRWSTAP
jgi:hypothetical protein